MACVAVLGNPICGTAFTAWGYPAPAVFGGFEAIRDG